MTEIELVGLLAVEFHFPSQTQSQVAHSLTMLVARRTKIFHSLEKGGLGVHVRIHPLERLECLDRHVLSGFG